MTLRDRLLALADSYEIGPTAGDEAQCRKLALAAARMALEEADDELSDVRFRGSLAMAEVDDKGKPVYDRNLAQIGIAAVDDCAAAIRALADEVKA